MKEGLNLKEVAAKEFQVGGESNQLNGRMLQSALIGKLILDYAGWSWRRIVLGRRVVFQPS
jgi:hypothetical protein